MAGLAFAQASVAALFDEAEVPDFPGWREANYAYWIETAPLRRWSRVELDGLPRIRG